MFPPVVVDGESGRVLALAPGGSAVVSVTSTVASAAYAESTGTVFSTEVAITVLDIDDDHNGIHDFSGATFMVTYAPVANSNPGCTSTASEIWG